MSDSTLKYQKIIKVGNSLALTLDKEFVTATKVKAGDLMAISYKPDKRVASMSPVAGFESANSLAEPTVEYEAEAKLASTITPEFQDWVKKSLSEDKESLEKLANL